MNAKNHNSQKQGGVHKLAQLRKTAKSEDASPPDYTIKNPINHKTIKRLGTRKYFSSNLSKDLIAYNLTLREEAVKKFEHEQNICSCSSKAKKKRRRLNEIVISSDEIKLKEDRSHVLHITKKYDKAIKSYKNMRYCCNELRVTKKEGVKRNLCKNRLCLNCNSIRTAELINKYKCVFDAWGQDIYMVTLTVQNCKGEALQSTIKEMLKVFTKVKDNLRKEKYKELIGRKFEGLRKIECTSIRDNDFHPHFHVLVRGKRAALALRVLWVRLCRKSSILHARLKVDYGEDNYKYIQDIRKADENSLKEIFKYFTKLISTSSKDRKVYIDRNDTIFKSMQGIRVFQPFGFKISDYNQQEKEIKPTTKIILSSSPLSKIHPSKYRSKFLDNKHPEAQNTKLLSNLLNTFDCIIQSDESQKEDNVCRSQFNKIKKENQKSPKQNILLDNLKKKAQAVRETPQELIGEELSSNIINFYQKNIKDKRNRELIGFNSKGLFIDHRRIRDLLESLYWFRLKHEKEFIRFCCEYLNIKQASLLIRALNSNDLRRDKYQILSIIDELLTILSIYEDDYTTFDNKEEVYLFDECSGLWVNDTGELICNYQISESMKSIVSNITYSKTGYNKMKCSY